METRGRKPESVKARLGTLGVALVVAGGGACTPRPSESPNDAAIVTEDLDRFWNAWDAAAEAEGREGRIAAFQRLYLDPGTPGLRDWVELRVESAENLVATIDAHPAYYAQLRRHTPQARAAAEPVRDAFGELERLYPAAVFPDVYIVVGVMSSGGTTSRAGLLIGADMYGLDDDTPTDELGQWHREVLASIDVLPHIIAHELVHYQQPPTPDDTTLLAKVLREGSADFVAERISGRHINEHVHAWGLAHEAEVWARFEPVMDATDGVHGFLYTGDARPEGWPADTGYFLGYRIAQAYAATVDDERQAIADILTLEPHDARAFLEASGYADKFTE